MEREIKFKAKSIEPSTDGKWVYGSSLLNSGMSGQRTGKRI